MNFIRTFIAAAFLTLSGCDVAETTVVAVPEDKTIHVGSVDDILEIECKDACAVVRGDGKITLFMEDGRKIIFTFSE